MSRTLKKAPPINAHIAIANSRMFLTCRIVLRTKRRPLVFGVVFFTSETIVADPPPSPVTVSPFSGTVMSLFQDSRSSPSPSSSFGYQYHTVSIITGMINPSIENPTEPTSDTSGPMSGTAVATITVVQKRQYNITIVTNFQWRLNELIFHT